jgi:chemotaxis protein MotB
MKSLRLLTLSTLLGLAVVSFSACSTAQKGAAGGGLAGGTAGAVVANNWATAVSPVTGAVIGGAGGAAVGGLAGDAYDQITDDDLERELENLRAELDNANEEIVALRETGANPEAVAEAKALRSRVGELENQIVTLENDLDSSRTLADQESTSRQGAEAQLAEMMEDKSALDSDLQLTRSMADQESTRLNDQVAALQEDNLEKSARLAELDSQVSVLRTSLSGKETAVEELKSELDQLNVQLEETSRGLTLTIVNSLLYNPGESTLSDGGQQLLADVAKILNDRFPTRDLLIEGHTDNQPIVHSGWRSNWELGAARALTILHELVDVQDIDPARVSATTYGEFKPSNTNVTADGKANNRRAVIVILPEKLPLQRATIALAD